ncbi:hypothetical protein V8C44DRAFT_328600 [Trichoderma aethiopicum]
MPRNDAISHTQVLIQPIPAPKNTLQSSKPRNTHQLQFNPVPPINVPVPVPPRKRTSGPGVPPKATKNTEEKPTSARQSLVKRDQTEVPSTIRKKADSRRG